MNTTGSDGDDAAHVARRLKKRPFYGILKVGTHTVEKPIIIITVTGKTLQRFVLATLLVGAGLTIGNHVRAADPLTVQIINPTPNALHLFGTPLLFEAAITAGAADQKYYRISWDLVYTGGAGEAYDVTQTQFFYNAAANGNATSIHYIDNTTQFATLRYVLQPNDALYTASYTPNASYSYRAQAEMCADVGCASVEATASASGSFSLYDELGFTGFAYVGASTGKCVVPGSEPADPIRFCSTDQQCSSGEVCGGDAPGYAAFNCTLQQASTCAKPYSVLYGVVGPTGHASLQNYSWFGQSDDVASGKPLGWLTFNRNSCAQGSEEKIGLSCATDTDCGIGGVCTVLADLDKPPVSLDPENWAGKPEINRVYNAPESVEGTKRLPGQLVGWGRLLTLADYGKTLTPARSDWGWAHLRGKEAARPYTSVPADQHPYLRCNDCAAATNDTAPKCNICSAVQTDATTTAQYACNSCYNCAVDGTSTSCSSCEICNRYGVSFDSQRGQLLGYGWTGGEQNGEAGLGWIRFDPAGGVSILQGWLATRYGDIFSGGNISSKAIPPAGSYNATYIIQANGNIGFSSQLGTDPSVLRERYPNEIRIPAAPTKYVNILGRINFPEIVIADGQIPPKRHRYGTTVLFGPGTDYLTLKDLPGASVDASTKTLTLTLNNTIYYYQGNLTLPDDPSYTKIEILAGTTENIDGIDVTTSGAGTIVVDGSVVLNGDITYENAAGLNDIVKISSLGWIIRGDLAINPLVGNLVGAFLVLGCPSDGSVATCDAMNQGTVHTGYSLDLPLVVKGLMMARSMVFERNIVGNLGVQGSEQVMYDGRFIANPPPGLQDLSAAVPSLRLDVPK